MSPRVTRSRVRGGVIDVVQKTSTTPSSTARSARKCLSKVDIFSNATDASVKTDNELITSSSSKLAITDENFSATHASKTLTKTPTKQSILSPRAAFGNLTNSVTLQVENKTPSGQTPKSARKIRASLEVFEDSEEAPSSAEGSVSTVRALSTLLDDVQNPAATVSEEVAAPSTPEVAHSRYPQPEVQACQQAVIETAELEVEVVELSEEAVIQPSTPDVQDNAPEPFNTEEKTTVEQSSPSFRQLKKQYRDELLTSRGRWLDAAEGEDINFESAAEERSPVRVMEDQETSGIKLTSIIVVPSAEKRSKAVNLSRKSDTKAVKVHPNDEATTLRPGIHLRFDEYGEEFPSPRVAAVDLRLPGTPAEPELDEWVQDDVSSDDWDVEAEHVYDYSKDVNRKSAVSYTTEFGYPKAQGLPASSGAHLRFEEGGVKVSPGVPRHAHLRGLPIGTGKHLHFDDGDDTSVH